MIPSLRGGMQVHAVPDNEKAFDANGRRLPWGFEYADTDPSGRRDPEERGPFGRSTRRRGFSRSKTATPARKEDAQRIENMHAEDAIFNSYNALQRQREALPTSKSTPLLSLEGGTGQGKEVEKEATEVILYGYGRDHAWAAIEFYERISGGSILEDYDRSAPGTRYDPGHSLSRARSQRSLSKASLAKRNRFRGGNHWIKVTFDSPEAADLACDRSPHKLLGYLVYAEAYRGAGPPKDQAIPCSNAGAMLDSESLPNSLSTKTLSRNMNEDTQTESPEGSSRTMSSATIGEPTKMRDLRDGGLKPPRLIEKSLSMSSLPAMPGSLLLTPTGFEHETRDDATGVKHRPMRIQGAKRAVLKPADQALMPTQPRYTGLLAFIPLLGLLFSGGKGDSESATIPKLESGEVDWNQAGLYWWFFAWLDGIFGTDTCGLKNDE